MKLRDKVMYLNRPAYIVGVRMPNHIIGEVGKFYDLCRRDHCPRPDWKNVPAHHIRLYEETTPVSCNGSVQFVKHQALELVK